MVTLGEGPLRFHLLRDRIEGISEKMLSQTLKSLVRDGLVRRLVEPTVPPRVTYELTPIGGELAAPLREVIERLGRLVVPLSRAAGAVNYLTLILGGERRVYRMTQ